MTDSTIEIPTELAARAFYALITGMEELFALHTIKYAHLEHTQNPTVRRKMEQDSKTLDAMSPVVLAFSDFLKTQGVDPRAVLKSFEEQNPDAL